MTQQIAFLGIGQMGSGMAGCLLDAGHQVRVYNRTEAKTRALVARGAVLAATPAEAAAGADAVFSMVGDDPASAAVWSGPEGALAAAAKPGALTIECSTLSHDWVLSLAAQATAAGYRYLDSPVTGLPDAAAAGKLVLFLGGPQTTIDAAQPLLDVISRQQMHFGEVGAGTAYKLIVNLMGSIQIAAAAEGLVVAERAGLDMDLVARALASGGCGSPQVARNAALMVAGEHLKDIAFSARWRLKDTDYGMRFARKLGLDPDVGKAALGAFQTLVEAGFGTQSETKIIDILRRSG